MIVVDASAIVAVILGEDEKELYLRILWDQRQFAVSVASMLEAHMAVTREFPQTGAAKIQAFRRAMGKRLRLRAVTQRQYRNATDAWTRFGRPSKNKYALNFGDCLSYALAREVGGGLLFKGNDFSSTDLQSAVLPYLH